MCFQSLMNPLAGNDFPYAERCISPGISFVGIRQPSRRTVKRPLPFAASTFNYDLLKLPLLSAALQAALTTVETTVRQLNICLRKSSFIHFFIYFILGLFIIRFSFFHGIKALLSQHFCCNCPINTFNKYSEAH